jgi:hypothetical protein
MSSKMLNVLLRNVAASLLLLLGSVTAQAAATHCSTSALSAPPLIWAFQTR